MIDFIKAKLIDRELMLNNLIDDKEKYLVTGKYDYTNKREEYPIKSERENLLVRITKKGGYIENSIHKYFNLVVGNGNQNFNDFYFCDLQLALDLLGKEIKYKLEDTVITNLEFGFNIEIDFSVKEFLEENLLMYDFREPCYNPKYNKKMKMKKFTLSHFEIKVYDKSLHYKYDDKFKGIIKEKNILRIEIKLTNKKLLNDIGIYNLTDLKDREKIAALMGLFWKKYDNLLIIDNYDGNSLMKKKEREFILRSTHPNYWIELRKNKFRNTVSNHKTKFRKLIKKYNLNSLKKDLKKLILGKFNQLMTMEFIDYSETPLKVA